MAGYSPWGGKELDTTKWLTIFTGHMNLIKFINLRQFPHREDITIHLCNMLLCTKPDSKIYHMKPKKLLVTSLYLFLSHSIFWGHRWKAAMCQPRRESFCQNTTRSAHWSQTSSLQHCEKTNFSSLSTSSPPFFCIFCYGSPRGQDI